MLWEFMNFNSSISDIFVWFLTVIFWFNSMNTIKNINIAILIRKHSVTYDFLQIMSRWPHWAGRTNDNTTQTLVMHIFCNAVQYQWHYLAGECIACSWIIQNDFAYAIGLFNYCTLFPKASSLQWSRRSGCCWIWALKIIHILKCLICCVHFFLYSLTFANVVNIIRNIFCLIMLKSHLLRIK